MKTKNLKVAYSSRYPKQGFCPVPKIQMEGKWLEELGFSVGSLLMVEYGEGSLHIRALTEEELAARKRQEMKAEYERKSTELKRLVADLSMVAEPEAPYASNFKGKSVKKN